jgi:hypothetical protein
MANVNASGYQTFVKDGPDGSDITQVLSFTGDASIADVIRFGTVAAGVKVLDLSVLVPATTADLTAQVGWAYVDGSAADPDAFIAAGTSLAAVGRVRANVGTLPIVFAKPAYLTMTIAGAALTAKTFHLVPVVQTIGQ